MRKTLTAVTVISALLFSIVTGAGLIDFGKANPNYPGGQTAPPADAEPPTITIFSFKNNTIFTVNNAALNFTVFVGKSPYHTQLELMYCVASWLQNETIVYRGYDANYHKTSISYACNLTNLPDGSHSITIYTTERGFYLGGSAIEVGKVNYVYEFPISNFWIVNFAVDTTTPKVSILSLENKTYDASDVQLDFNVNESVSNIKLSLDGQKNVTVTGNTTLTSLSNGAHNITVYATDIAGHTGASETMYFNVGTPEPFPTATAATAAGASVTIIGVGLLVYFKKRRHQTEMVGSK